jgi:hypothetical protein
MPFSEIPFFVFELDENDGDTDKSLSFCESASSTFGLSPSDSDVFEEVVSVPKHRISRPMQTTRRISHYRSFDFSRVHDCVMAVGLVVNEVQKHVSSSNISPSPASICLTLGSILRDACGWCVVLGSETHFIPNSTMFDSVLVAGPCDIPVCVVDFDFASKFIVPWPSRQNSTFMDAVPNIFVGSIEELTAEVNRAALALRNSFGEEQMVSECTTTDESLLSMYEKCLAEDCQQSCVVLDNVSKRLDQLRSLPDFLPRSISLSLLSDDRTSAAILELSEAAAMAANIRTSLQTEASNLCEDMMTNAKKIDEIDDMFEKIDCTSLEEMNSGLSIQLELNSVK